MCWLCSAAGSVDPRVSLQWTWQPMGSGNQMPSWWEREGHLTASDLVPLEWTLWFYMFLQKLSLVFCVWFCSSCGIHTTPPTLPFCFVGNLSLQLQGITLHFLCGLHTLLAPSACNLVLFPECSRAVTLTLSSGYMSSLTAAQSYISCLPWTLKSIEKITIAQKWLFCIFQLDHEISQNSVYAVQCGGGTLVLQSRTLSFKSATYQLWHVRKVS